MKARLIGYDPTTTMTDVRDHYEVTYRRARVDDLESVVELGIEALKKTAYQDNMVISKSRVRQAVREAISGAGCYCAVAVYDGRIVAVVSAIVHDFMSYERKQASVIQFYAVKPGAGIRLIRDFLKWARARPAIKAIVFTVEAKADPRIVKLLMRLGLKSSMPVMMEIL